MNSELNTSNQFNLSLEGYEGPIDLLLDLAKKQGIETEIIHNASILTAIGITGLQLYKFGKTTSIPLKNENIEAPYDVLKLNLANNLHTLFILDLDNEKNIFLTINNALKYLLKINNEKKENILNEKVIACARIGSKDQIIKYREAKEIMNLDFGKPPFCLIIPSKLHFMEEEALNNWRI